MHFDIVIVGNSAAGLSVISTLRRYDNKLSIGLFDREEYPAYARVSLPYYIAGKAERNKLFIVDRSYYDRLGVSAFLGQEVIQLDPSRKEIRTLQGMSCTYGKLFWALVAKPKKLCWKETGHKDSDLYKTGRRSTTPSKEQRV